MPSIIEKLPRLFQLYNTYNVVKTNKVLPISLEIRFSEREALEAIMSKSKLVILQVKIR